MSRIATIGYERVVSEISPQLAVELVSEAFRKHALNEWAMPSKVYVQSPGHGDFRAMPALGAGLAIVKWVTSFPQNPEHGLPVVYGTVLVSSAATGEPLAFIDGRAVTALRTGAAAAVATQTLARSDARSVGIVGCGMHGSWAARCLKASGYADGICFDLRPDAAQALAQELDWRAGSHAQALGCKIVCTVTHGARPVVSKSDLQPGTHFNALGADGPGKAEFELDALLECELFCDEWEQAAHGGELTQAVTAGKVTRSDVTELGWILTGAGYKREPDAITLFDSTGLAIQDLAICVELIERLNDGRFKAPSVDL